MLSLTSTWNMIIVTLYLQPDTWYFILDSQAWYIGLFSNPGGNLTASSFSASACQQIHSELLESVNQIYQVILLVIFQANKI